MVVLWCGMHKNRLSGTKVLRRCVIVKFLQWCNGVLIGTKDYEQFRVADVVGYYNFTPLSI